ncbi:hypothetical protein RRF57_004981 [Xylaria bambusicola]|uniref:Uncharacterized protein n=1 Tax=Xylaria bambusicola TaxID=326684 RepID=A0AAN7UMQ4_9PEZI
MPREKDHISQFQSDALTVATELSSKILHAPNPVRTLAAWATDTNKYIEEVQVLVNEYLERIVVNETKLEARKQADFARLISLFYPDAEWPELKVAAAYTVWIFVWDDEVDTGDIYRESIAYARFTLGPDDHISTANGDTNVVIPPHRNMTLFADFGSVLLWKIDIQQRQRFFDNFGDFMERFHLEDQTSRVITGCDVMTALWKEETTRICIVLNDLYSAQKEMESFLIISQQIHNLTPRF